MRTIIEQIERQGLPVRRIVAMGGVAQKNPLLMQVIADVLGRELAVSSVQEGAAQGAAIAAAACAGLTPSVEAAVRTMGQPVRAVYRPSGNQAAYDALYREYTALHDYFGRGGSEVMHRLARLSALSVSSNQPID
jgi:L-ribulokinase